MMDAFQRAVPAPEIKIVEQRAARRKVFRDRPPLATRAQDIHDAVHHFPQIDTASVAAALGRWNQRRNERPVLFRQIARVTQAAAVVPLAVLCCPHGDHCSNQATTLESQMIHPIQYLPGQTLRGSGFPRPRGGTSIMTVPNQFATLFVRNALNQPFEIFRKMM